MKQMDNVMTIDTSPSIFDIIGSYDDEYKVNPELFEDWVEQFNANNNTKYTPATLPEGDCEICLAQLFGDDCDRYSIHWEDTVENFQYLLNQNGFEEGDEFKVTAQPANWRGQTGWWYFGYDGKAEHFIRETFAKLDRDFRADISEIGLRRMTATVYCHDIPMGSVVTIEAVRRCENCGRHFSPKHRNHIYCSASCRREYLNRGRR